MPTTALSAAALAAAGAEPEPQPLLSAKCKRAGRHLDEGRAGSSSCQRCSQLQLHAHPPRSQATGKRRTG